MSSYRSLFHIAVLFVLLTLAVWAQVGVPMLDASAEAFVGHIVVPLGTTIFEVITTLADPLVAVLVLCGCAWTMRRRRDCAIALIVSVAGATLSMELCKALVARTRPHEIFSILNDTSYSFPSGHSALSVALYGFLAYCAMQLLRGPRRYVASILCVLLIIGIGLSRVYLGYHYVTDVVGGYMLGGMWLIIAIHVSAYLRTRSRH